MSDLPRSADADPSGDRDPSSRHLSELQRYAGWLGKDYVSRAVRADVVALGAAIDNGNGVSVVLLALDNDIERLPSGGIRTMLRRALVEMRAALPDAEIDESPIR